GGGAGTAAWPAKRNAFATVVGIPSRAAACSPAISRKRGSANVPTSVRGGAFDGLSASSSPFLIFLRTSHSGGSWSITHPAPSATGESSSLFTSLPTCRRSAPVSDAVPSRTIGGGGSRRSFPAVGPSPGPGGATITRQYAGWGTGGAAAGGGPGGWKEDGR